MEFNKAIRSITAAQANDSARMRTLDSATLTDDYVPQLLRQRSTYEAQMRSLPQPAHPSPYLGDDRNYSSN